MGAAAQKQNIPSIKATHQDATANGDWNNDKHSGADAGGNRGIYPPNNLVAAPPHNICICGVDIFFQPRLWDGPNPHPTA